MTVIITGIEKVPIDGLDDSFKDVDKVACVTFGWDPESAAACRRRRSSSSVLCFANFSLRSDRKRTVGFMTEVKGFEGTVPVGTVTLNKTDSWMWQLPQFDESEKIVYLTVEYIHISTAVTKSIFNFLKFLQTEHHDITASKAASTTTTNLKINKFPGSFASFRTLLKSLHFLTLQPNVSIWHRWLIIMSTAMPRGLPKAKLTF